LLQRLEHPLQQQHPGHERRDQQVLVQRMRPVAVHPQTVQGCHPRGGEVAVAAAAGEGVDQVDAKFRRQCAGVLKQRRDGVRLAIRRTVDPARDLQPDRGVVGLQGQDAGHCRLSILGLGHAQVDLVIGHRLQIGNLAGDFQDRLLTPDPRPSARRAAARPR